MEIKDCRQPMVTSIGVILGFLMGFLGQWVTEPTFKLASASDYMVFVGCLAGVLLLVAFVAQQTGVALLRTSLVCAWPAAHHLVARHQGA